MHRITQGPLPTSDYDLVDDAGDVIGFAQLRHQPSCNDDLPPEAGNHVFYTIAAPHRGRGHGKALLRLVLDEARRIGLERVRLTVTTDNATSRHIIQSNGAVWLRDFVCKRGLTYQLFRIDLNARPRGKQLPCAIQGQGDQHGNE